MTATLLDRDAHAGAAADARRARSREIADDVAWTVAQHAPARQVDGIARDLRDYRTTDGARVVPTWEPEHGDLDVRAQVDWLMEDHQRLAREIAERDAEIRALRAQNARLLSQTPYSEDHRAALLAVYAKRAPVAQDRAA